MVDPGRLRRLLEALSEYRQELERAPRLPEYRRERAYAGRYLVQAAAQACIEMANHVIASSGWRTPADFRDAFTVLEEQRVIDHDLANRIARSPGFATGSFTSMRSDDDRIADAAAVLSNYAQAIARLVERG